MFQAAKHGAESWPRASWLQSIWTTENGLRMHTRVSAGPAGHGLAPVVCVHGLSVSSRYMVPTALRLAERRRVYAPDMPGFGRSQHPREILGIPALAEALARRMDALGIGSAVLLGNSLGCQVIAELALRWPERVVAAVLTGPTMDRRALSVVEQASRLLRDMPREPASSLVMQASDYLACGPRRTIGTLRRGLADRIERKLPLLRAPTLIVRGERDPIAPQRWAEELAALLPHGRLAVVPGAPHAVNYTSPDQLAALVLAFLSESGV